MAEQITNYQCPACTGPLHYSESLGKLKCDYCGTEYEVAEIEAMYAKKEEKSVEAQKKAEKETEQKKQQQISHALREVLDGGSEEQLFELCDLFEKYPYFLMEIRVPHGETKKSKRATMLTLAGEVLTGCFDEGMFPFLVKQEEKILGLFF